MANETPGVTSSGASASGRPPPLQLLVRRSDDAFEYREVDSRRALLRMRPRRVAGLALDERALGPDEGGGRVVHVRGGDVYLRMNPLEELLWEHMDGETSMQELATHAFLASRSLDPAAVFGFLARARKAGLVEVAPSGWVHTVPVPVAMRAEWRWDDVDGGVQRLLGVVRRFVNRWTALPLALGVLVSIALHVTLPATQAPLVPWASVAVFVLGWLVGIVPHEACHALACAAFGRRVRAVGVGWMGAWVDTTDMFLSGRAAHGLVALAGPAGSLLVAAIAAGFARVAGSSVAQVVANALLAQALVTAWPFLGWTNDGLHALGDLLREARLPRDSVRAVREGRPAARHVAYLLAVTGTWLVLVWGFVARALPAVMG